MRKSPAMSSNRNRKQAIRAYMAQHHLPYTEAARSIGRASRPSPLTGQRWRRASQVLNTVPAELPAALSAFAGLRPSSGAAADELINRILEHLDNTVPLGVRNTTQDLWDATDALADVDLDPPIPATVSGAAAFVATLLSRLSPNELQVAATQLRYRDIRGRPGPAVDAPRVRTPTGRWPW
jgi:hypothetical protein